jgi:Leucine-rich repeat (LRR) protein
MKRLLLLFTILATLNLSNAQAPPNDLIANAIEIDPTDYVENNLRLDLATSSGINPAGCGTAGFSDVYYKFTATSDTSINTSITDMANGAITQSWIIFYNAPDLNQTNESQFSLASGCTGGTLTNLTLSSGQTYYIQVHRNDANALTRFISIEQPDVPDVPESERAALIAFYNATGGDNWVNNTNWNTSAPVRTWFGINTSTTDIFGQTYTDGLEHVQSLSFLQFNNIAGSLPSELANLTKLAGMNFINNPLNGTIPDYIYDYPQLVFFRIQNSEMSGTISPNIQNATNLRSLLIDGNNFSGPIPDLTNLPSFDRFLFIQNNSFQFGDFENQFSTYQSTIDNFSYTPQKPLSPKPNIIASNGDIISIPAEVSGAQNNYEWYKRTSLFNTDVVSTEETLDFVFDDASEGTYFLRVTSNLVPNLVLITPDFTIGQDPTTSSDYATLIDFYNSTDGPNWTNNTNWLNPNVPLSEWHGITTENNRVTEFRLQSNALTGQIPSFVTNLTELTTIFVNSNNLEGTIPDLSTMTNLATLEVSNNNFDFIDFEANFNNNTTILSFVYSPQKPRDEEISFDGVIGNDYSFTMTPILGTNIDYQWYAVNPSITTQGSEILLSGNNTNTLSFNNIQSIDFNAYTCEATSNTIPGLSIRRNIIEIKGAVSTVERDALIAIYNATNGPFWVNSENWNTTEPVSTWTGVTVVGNKIKSLNIGGFNLNGQIPTEIGNLLYLEELYLGFLDYFLVGEIPATIGNLSMLRRFWIQATGLTGSIPDTFGNLTEMRDIRLLGSNFTGNLPESFSNLTQLTSLVIPGNEFNNIGSDFSGVLPASLNNLTNLLSISIENNSFTGNLPFNSPNANISITNNHFDFSDIEPFFVNGNYRGLNYSPQLTEDIAENITSGIGATLTLNVNDTDIDRDSNDTAINNNYQWYKDEVAITGANAADYTITNAQITDSGDYFGEITNSILPDLIIVRAPISVLVDPSLSTTDSETTNFVLFPNPAKNWISVKIKSGTNAVAQVFDIMGKLILKKELSSEITAIALDKLPSGMYLIKVSNDTMQSTKRFIKQ